MKVKNVYRMVHTMGKTQPGGVSGGTESSEKECILWKEKAEERVPARSGMAMAKARFSRRHGQEEDVKCLENFTGRIQAAVCAEKEKMSV